MMEIVLFILLFLATFKALLYKMSMLAILEYYVEQGASIPGKRANPRIPNKSIEEMAAYQITK